MSGKLCRSSSKKTTSPSSLNYIHAHQHNPAQNAVSHIPRLTQCDTTAAAPSLVKGICVFDFIIACTCLIRIQHVLFYNMGFPRCLKTAWKKIAYGNRSAEILAKSKNLALRTVVAFVTKPPNEARAFPELHHAPAALVAAHAADLHAAEGAEASGPERHE